MIAIGTTIILVGVMSYAFAEKTTELYIPISSGIYSVRVTERTVIFLDRSKVKLKNLYGTFADCKRNIMAEVRFEEDSQAKPAEWVKLQIDR
jgi:hypothetical protein